MTKGNVWKEGSCKGAVGAPENVLPQDMARVLHLHCTDRSQVVRRLAFGK